MKARKLRQILNNTEYIISNREDCICVGSPLCSNLISVDKKTLKVKYALDTFRKGRKALEDKYESNDENELLFIWDKLHELIESGEINDIINGKDTIENPLPVFTVNDGVLIESVTDRYGWSNTDDNGILMYDNTHFPTAKQALEYGIKEAKAGIKLLTSTVESKEEDLLKFKGYLDERKSHFEKLTTELNNILENENQNKEDK